MAAMFTPNSSPGLHNVPVSMGLLGYLILSCAAVNVPSMYHLHKYFLCRIPEDLTMNSQILKLVTSKLIFLDPKDLIWAGTLVYQFREFERRYGSRKFASLLVGSSCLSFVLELMAHLIRWFIDKDGGSGILSIGPYGLLFPLFVNFYKEIPNTTQGGSNRNNHQRSLDYDNQQWNAPFAVLGTIFPPISTKTITYLFGFQLAWSSVSSFIAAITGVVAGILYRKNFLYIQKLIFIPGWLARIGNLFLKLFVDATPPGGQGGNNNGSEQSRWARVQHPANSDDGVWNRQIRRQGQGFAETLVYPDNYWMGNQNGGNIFGGFLGSWRQHNLLENEEFEPEDFGRERGDGVEIEELNVSEEEINGGIDVNRRTNDNIDSEKVAKLVDMGFQKDKAQKALISTNFDLIEATNVLLRMETSQPPAEDAVSMPSSSGDVQLPAPL
ncbi:ubiquitin-associated domain-containing protein 2-like isoform X2 [Ischnura elegans]|uniref:ubiquitin-associated domain-containing protein 2-like isoform X2 n=1 Tax=Ischnura elegans TaxID=197161 RepID=UPI001ED8A8AD|nr:ubiquitin-associated domain-containing protein 2-like isoform X2 [Ischnura elegans]